MPDEYFLPSANSDVKESKGGKGGNVAWLSFRLLLLLLFLLLLRYSLGSFLISQTMSVESRIAIVWTDVLESMRIAEVESRQR
jgi:hypothetical protein